MARGSRRRRNDPVRAKGAPVGRPGPLSHALGAAASGLHPHVVAQLRRQLRRVVQGAALARGEGGDAERRHQGDGAVVAPDAHRHLDGLRHAGVRGRGAGAVDLRHLALHDAVGEAGRVDDLRAADQLALGVRAALVLLRLRLGLGEHGVHHRLRVVDRAVDAAEGEALLGQAGAVLVTAAHLGGVLDPPLLEVRLVGVAEAVRGVVGAGLLGVRPVDHRGGRDQLVRAVVRDARAAAAGECEVRAHRDRRHHGHRADDQARLLLAAGRLGGLGHAVGLLTVGLLAVGVRLLAVRVLLRGHAGLLRVAVPRLLRRRGLRGVAVAGLRRGLRGLSVRAGLRRLSVRTRLPRLSVRAGLPRLSVRTRLLGWLAVRARLVAAHFWDPPRTLMCP
ncbi:hypothetical protein SGPA1_30455 [Streptomyces misionensis JCM 4497]